MDDLLRQLIDGQKEQTELLRRYLWRLRFSLLGLLLLTTVTAIGLGILVYEQQTKTASVAPTAATFTVAPAQGTLILSTPPSPNGTWGPATNGAAGTGSIRLGP
jgi:hypothetical protein